MILRKLGNINKVILECVLCKEKLYMKSRKLSITAMLVALSFIGANVKIMGTIAFDSMPAFLAALYLGSGYGAAVGALGHFFTALLSGFPLSLPVHIIIMIDMVVTMIVFGNIYKKYIETNDEKLKAIIMAGIAGVLVNGPGSMLLLLPFLLPMMGAAGILIYLPILSAAAACNILLAYMLYRVLAKRLAY